MYILTYAVDWYICTYCRYLYKSRMYLRICNFKLNNQNYIINLDKFSYVHVLGHLKLQYVVKYHKVIVIAVQTNHPVSFSVVK